MVLEVGEIEHVARWLSNPGSRGDQTPILLHRKNYFALQIAIFL